MPMGLGGKGWDRVHWSGVSHQLQWKQVGPSQRLYIYVENVSPLAFSMHFTFSFLLCFVALIRPIKWDRKKMSVTLTAIGQVVRQTIEFFCVCICAGGVRRDLGPASVN